METIMMYAVPVIGFLLTIGVVWKYASKLLSVIKEVADLLNVLIVALADQKLSQEEIQQIIKEAKDIPAAVKEALKK